MPAKNILRFPGRPPLHEVGEVGRGQDVCGGLGLSRCDDVIDGLRGEGVHCGGGAIGGPSGFAVGYAGTFFVRRGERKMVVGDGFLAYANPPQQFSLWPLPPEGGTTNGRRPGENPFVVPASAGPNNPFQAILRIAESAVGRLASVGGEPSKESSSRFFRLRPAAADRGRLREATADPP